VYDIENKLVYGNEVISGFESENKLLEIDIA
jgi:hypothetical protein